MSRASTRQNFSWDQCRSRPLARQSGRPLAPSRRGLEQRGLQVEGDGGGSARTHTRIIAFNQSRSLAATPRCPDAAPAGRVSFFLGTVEAHLRAATRLASCVRRWTDTSGPQAIAA